MRVLGFMSGTSADGVDAAVLETDGETIGGFGPAGYRPYAPEERARLKAAMRRAAELGPARLREEARVFAEEAALAATAHIEAGAAVLAQGAGPIDAIGFHGQTLLHRPEESFTLQIGDAAAVARALGAPTVFDFRAADVAAGGQGAPLAPFYHFALARGVGATTPRAFLNLGGVANVTWVDPTAAGPDAPGALTAFDVGPANALIDDVVLEATGAAYDAEGRIAARGRARRERVADWIARTPFFAAPPPKSLDRDDLDFVRAEITDLSLEDAAATLTAFTAAAAAAGASHLPAPPAQWLLCGGGRRNPTMAAELAAALDAPVRPIDELALGDAMLDGDMVEAQAFAHLAARSLRGLSLTAPGSTGAPRPLSGGRRAAP